MAEYRFFFLAVIDPNSFGLVPLKISPKIHLTALTFVYTNRLLFCDDIGKNLQVTPSSRR